MFVKIILKLKFNQNNTHNNCIIRPHMQWPHGSEIYNRKGVINSKTAQ